MFTEILKPLMQHNHPHLTAQCVPNCHSFTQIVFTQLVTGSKRLTDKTSHH